MSIVGYIFLGVLGVVIWYFIFAYNNLVKLRNVLKNAWSQVDVLLVQRYDAIPNLVENLKGYLKHEKEVLENVTRYRSRALEATGIPEKIEAEKRLETALNQLNVVIERYPELKANENFLVLHEDLLSFENKIAYARQAYNDAAYFLNNKIEQFPSNIIAGIFNFNRATYFEAEEHKREVPKVSFS
ncbi:MAG TPA: LemA family protein [Bacillota bacterium]|jgi:LemA protein|nr:LemA family protein [Bacillota bacterium]HOL11027.1 LemA family protein [Bacillota bacterium]